MYKILKIIGLIKLTCYKLCGYNIKFTHHTFFHPCAKIAMKKHSYCSLESKVHISKNCTIKIDANGKAIYSKNVTIMPNTFCEVGENAELTIMRNCFINRDCKIICMEKIYIGEHCAIAPNVSLYDHDHIVKPTGEQDWNLFKSAPICVGADPSFCAYAIILRGSTIGNHCIIGANTIVKTTVPDKSIYYNKIQPQIQKIK